MGLLRHAVPVILAAGSAVAGIPSLISPVKADETILFFTSAAWPAPDEPGVWLAEVRGIIFENEQSRLLAAVLRRMIGLTESDLAPEEIAILRQRLALFTVDCERGKALRIVLAGQIHELPASGPNGHFRTTLRLPESLVADRKTLGFTAVLREGDTRRFDGKILFQPDDAGRPLVISDIDDTIKLTQVPDRAELRMNTFCRPFRPVPGMAEVYRRWESRDGAQFHYVSGSPWQLYGPLEAFAAEGDFPAGAWHLKPLRFKEPATVRAFFGSQHPHKTAGIRALMERWPRRPVVLVGDTGEHDPEIYADLARRYPERVHRIFLRNVTAESRSGGRFTAAFEGVPAEKWTLFEEAGEISGLMPERGAGGR